MPIELLDKIAPKNDGFVGMVDADQVLGGNGSGTFPDACVSASNVSQHPPKTHKDSHDPEDGADALDTAAASEIVGVQASGAGSSHSLARADHAHQIQHGIADNHLLTVDDADAADNDYAKFTADGLEGCSFAEVLSDLSNQATANFRFPTTIKLEFRDADIFIHSNADGELTIEADVKLTLGAAGDVEIGDGTLRDMYPNTDRKIDLGTSTHKFNDGWFGGILDFTESGARGRLVIADVSDPPTNAEITGEFGTPAAAGLGWYGFIKDSNSDKVWSTVSIGASNWFYSEMTKAV